MSRYSDVGPGRASRILPPAIAKSVNSVESECLGSFAKGKHEALKRLVERIPELVRNAGGDLHRLAGREVRYLPLSPEEYASELVTHGMPEAEARPIAELIAEVLDGRNSYLTQGVQQALGRPPRDFADYASDTAASGGWDLERKAS